MKGIYLRIGAWIKNKLNKVFPEAVGQQFVDSGRSKERLPHMALEHSSGQIFKVAY